MSPHFIDLAGTLFFAMAILHTFFAGRILRRSHFYAPDSLTYSLLHLLGEIEIVFAFWGALFMLLYIAHSGWTDALRYFESLHFGEPLFILVVMVLCSTRPLLTGARQLIYAVALGIQKLLGVPAVLADIFVTLVLGSLSGSFITEPAAMTVTAFLLHSIMKKGPPYLLYALLAVLFVNISIGGALTPFAAPPILMVAKTWQWDFTFVFSHLGWKSAVAVLLNSLGFVFFFRRQLLLSCESLQQVNQKVSRSGPKKIPVVITVVHLLFLVLIVLTARHPAVFIGIFLVFLGWVSVSRTFQEPLRFRESLLIATFLAGIIFFGAFQQWWLTPLLAQMTNGVLFMGAVSVTAITDNAALTFLGAQVPQLSESSKFALVAGALAGGGLTIIANAPNAAGYSILKDKFPEGLHPGKLFLAALAPTTIAILCLWVL